MIVNTLYQGRAVYAPKCEHCSQVIADPTEAHALFISDGADPTTDAVRIVCKGECDTRYERKMRQEGWKCNGWIPLDRFLVRMLATLNMDDRAINRARFMHGIRDCL